MNTRNRGANVLCLLALLCAAPRQSESAQWQVRAVQAVDAIEKPAGSSLQLVSPSRRFELQLEPNTNLVAGGRVGDTEALRGSLPGQPGSWVRLTRRNGQYRGLYSDGVQVYVLESAAAAATTNRQAAAMDPATTVIYRMADVTVSGVLLEGDVVTTQRSGTAALGLVGAEIAAAAMQATKRLDVGVLADSELVALLGASTDSKVLERLNVIDGIFSSQVGVQIHLGGVAHLDTAAAKLASTDPPTLLDAVAAYRLNTPSQQAFGLTHLMTGRDLDGTTVGTAFLGALCSQGFSASLSEARGTATLDGLIAAHEIGHVFGAPHDGDAAAACAATPDNQFLMAPRLSGSSTFSACSLQQMAPTIAAASCLAAAITPAPVADLAVTLSGDGAQVAVGSTVLLRATLQNLGSADVTDAQFVLGLPPGVTASAVASTGLSCAISAGAVNCPAFMLGANAVATLDLTLRVDQTGSLAVSASLRSPTLTDPQPGNNSATATLTGVAAPTGSGGSGANPSGNSGGGGSGAALASLVVLLLALQRAGRRYWPVLLK